MLNVKSNCDKILSYVRAILEIVLVSTLGNSLAPRFVADFPSEALGLINVRSTYAS